MSNEIDHDKEPSSFGRFMFRTVVGAAVGATIGTILLGPGGGTAVGAKVGGAIGGGSSESDGGGGGFFS
jgi:hypothetical protein